QFLIFKSQLKHIKSLTLSQSKEPIDIIEFLYTSDIVHHEIRPQNLMLDYHEEHIKLIDFGFVIKYEINENTKKLPIAGTVTIMNERLI
ncbi:unnamed protein product, partial [Rotaria magnacalcarata]